MHVLPRLSVGDLAAMSRAVLQASQAAPSMEACATSVVQYLNDKLTDEKGEPACVLVRFFKTHSLGDLDEYLRTTARDALPEGVEAAPGIKCLTLLASAGLEPDWNSRHSSRGHKVIPLPSVKMVDQFPMISQLIRQLGFEVSDIVSPDPDVVLQLQERGSQVFFIADAADSPHIPAQDAFVRPYGVRSVVGFGDVLPSGNLFVVVMFTRVVVPRDRAEMLNILSIGIKAAVLRFDYGTVFASAS